MANVTLFRSLIGALIPRTTARNEAGGPAYLRSPEQALAQLAATGCFNATFYAGAEIQLDRVVDLAGRVAPEFAKRRRRGSHYQSALGAQRNRFRRITGKEPDSQYVPELGFPRDS